jgi:hypothetical protein
MPLLASDFIQNLHQRTLLICILDQFEASHPSFPLLIVLVLVLIRLHRVCPPLAKGIGVLKGVYGLHQIGVRGSGG